MAKTFNLDESIVRKIDESVATLKKPILTTDDVAELMDESFGEPITADRVDSFVKMANQVEDYVQSGTLDENMNVTGDIAKYNKQLLPLLRRMLPKLDAVYALTSVQPVDAPTSEVFVLRSNYTGNILTGENVSLVVVDIVDTADITPPAVGTEITGNGGAKAEVVFVETNAFGGNAKKLRILAKVTVAGNGFQVGDDAGVGTATIANSYTNEMFFKQILPSYSGSMTTATGEKLGARNATTGAITNPFNEVGVSIEKMPITVSTRKLKARVSLELLQDLEKLFGVDGINEVNKILANEVALEIDYTAIEEVKKVAKVQSNYTVHATSSGSRWFMEAYQGLLSKILFESTAIAGRTRRGRANKLITTTRVISSLQTLGMLNGTATSAGNAVGNGQTFKVGTLKGSNIEVFHDFYSDEEYVLLERVGESFDAPIVYSPYIALQFLQATDPDTLQPVLGVMSRDAFTPNTTYDQPSASVSYFTVDFANTPIS